VPRHAHCSPTSRARRRNASSLRTDTRWTSKLPSSATNRELHRQELPSLSPLKTGPPCG
jgi:hypothetical protein